MPFLSPSEQYGASIRPELLYSKLIIPHQRYSSRETKVVKFNKYIYTHYIHTYTYTYILQPTTTKPHSQVPYNLYTSEPWHTKAKQMVYSPLAVPAACFYDVMLQQGTLLAEVHVHEMLLISSVAYSAQSTTHTLENDKW